MRKLAITLIASYFSLSLHATSIIPQELEEFSKKKIKIETRYPEFKKHVLEMVETLQSLEHFAKRELRELIIHIDLGEEKKVDGFISDMIALLSQPTIKDDETTLKETREFYTSAKIGFDKDFSTPCEKERKEKAIDVIARASLPKTKFLHAHSNAASTMLEQLTILHSSHNTYVNKGCLIAPDSEGIPFLNVLAVTKLLLRKACILFWWGERMIVENFLRINPKDTDNLVSWKSDTDDWNGTSRKTNAAASPSIEALKDQMGVATKLRLQILNTSNAVFKHQLTGFYINGWNLHDLGLVFPKLKPFFVAYGKKVAQPILDTSLTPFISLEERIKCYDKGRGDFSKGIFSYTDATDMLSALDAFFEKGHALKCTAMNQEATRQVEDLKISLSWEKYEQEKEENAAKPSANIFIQAAIEERKNRFKEFDPASIATTNAEGLQRAKILKILLNDEHIRLHLANSSLYQAILHYDFITKTFDILDDSWNEAHRSKVNSSHMNRIKGLFRKSYYALQESYTLIMDHLFLLYERHPLPKPKGSIVSKS